MEQKRKKPLILLLSDDMRLHSGIATMSKELILHTSHKFDWLQVGAAVKHPDEGKFFDVSDSVNKEAGIDNANVRIIPQSGYGNPQLIRNLMTSEQPDAILHFTDPRFWGWLYDMEDEIRRHIPLLYYNIWDDLPDPMWNAPFYGSCDLLMSISKQTYGINKRVLDKFGMPYADWQLQYVPHGVSEKFHPIDEDSDEYQNVVNMKKKLGIANKEFVVLYNNRNIRRKNPADVILAYKTLCDSLTPTQAKGAVLLMHTAKVDPNGTDLPEVIKNVCPDYDVVFTNSYMSTEDLNVLYNCADVTVNMASNEGFGLATAESVSAGTPIVVNITGGMQDHCNFSSKGRFLTEKDYITLGSLHDKKNLPPTLMWGNWVKPVWPSNRSLQGSPATPYIFDDRCKFEDVGETLKRWYDTPRERRNEFGREGSSWMKSKESGMSASQMGARMIKAIETTFEKWEPKTEITLWKI